MCQISSVCIVLVTHLKTANIKGRTVQWVLFPFPNPNYFCFKDQHFFRSLAKIHVLPSPFLPTVGHLLLRDFLSLCFEGETVSSYYLLSLRNDGVYFHCVITHQYPSFMGFPSQNLGIHSASIYQALSPLFQWLSRPWT